MSDEITFLPSLRRGLAQALENPDPLRGGLPRGPTIDAWVDVEGKRTTQVLRVHGPEAVTGVAAAQVLRSEPRPDSAGVEPDYLACVELAAPDLPWMFTPARADTGQGRLRPWLVLVVVREQDGVAVTSGAGLPVLHIEPPAVPADELPDLADSWAWAHVHSLVGTDGIEAAVTAATGEVFARLLSPRRLLADRAWVACLVPAFADGVARGLGAPLPEGETVRPAWTDASLGDAIRLPVYHHWRFSTGPAGDFESLCQKLKPDGDGAEMGLHAMDVGDPGLIEPAPKRVLLDMAGALHTLEARPRPWDTDHREDFERQLPKLLDAGVARAPATLPADGEDYDPLRHDPVVAPPMYGAQPADVAALPADGWMRELNLDPVHRAAAGLGARTVRAAQEALVAAAWDQAGELRATVSAVNRGRLGVELGRSLTRRAAVLSPGDVMQLTGRLHAVLPAGTTTVRALLDDSDIPNGLVSAAYLRQTRPGTPLARDWAARRGSPTSRLGARHTRLNLDATAAAATKIVLEFAAFGVPAGAWVSDPTLQETAPRAARVVPTPGSDVSAIAATVLAALDPLPSVRANLLSRVPALAGEIATGELPTSVPVGPSFPDPLYWDLLGLGSSWVLPGVDSLRRNRVRLVEAELPFVGAFLVGANHELGRELLWRGYPVDLRATFFHRFWDYVDATNTDIPDLHTWDVDLSLRDLLGGPDKVMTVIVVRGDLVRRYPTAHYYLQAAGLEDGEAVAVEGTERPADFLGTLDRDTLFVGFAGLRPEDVRGDRSHGVPGMFVVIEEQAGAPRFGLDAAKDAHFDEDPTTWNRLSWGHTVAGHEELDALSHARSDHERLVALGELEQTTWGYNAAHIARACWQRPFRRLIHADLLI